MLLALAHFCLDSLSQDLARKEIHTPQAEPESGLFGLRSSDHGVQPGDGQLPDPTVRFLEPLYPLLSCETLSLVGFGIAWLTKGKGFPKPKLHSAARLDAFLDKRDQSGKASGSNQLPNLRIAEKNNRKLPILTIIIVNVTIIFVWLFRKRLVLVVHQCGRLMN
jgi:hypothetical protein